MFWLCFCNLTLPQLQQRKGPKKEWSGNKREMKEKEELEKVAASPAVYVHHYF
jgi:hypothetical protein